MNNSRKSGFTLIEIMVVLAIAAIISSITLGAFRSISEGNRRTSCQTNLSQIYQSCRLYAQDYDGTFPYLNGVAGLNEPAAPKGGMGLWSLYTFPKFNPNNCSAISVDLPQPAEFSNVIPPVGPSLAGYVRSPKIFHCPADSYDNDIEFRAVATPNSCTLKKDLKSDGLTFVDGSQTYLNPTYLSYQAVDVDIQSPATPLTYSSFRSPDVGSSSNKDIPIRQLIPYVESSSTVSTPERPTRQMTVVTWCRFHRKLDSKDKTTVSGRRNYDNVLFSDGSVQFLPMKQDVSEDSGPSAVCEGAYRVPRDNADSMYSAKNCIPSP
jgi:prepilin-type N-terminal cleavage/methylation domain-containing protein